MSEQGVPGAAMPSLTDAAGWVGFEIDEAGGSRIGRVQAVFADPSGEPAWLIAAMARRGLLRWRRRGADLVAIPVRDCAAAPGRVWTAHGREALRTAPTVDPARPLLREHELAICAHYGIGERVGRAAEVAGRDEGAVTALPNF